MDNLYGRRTNSNKLSLSTPNGSSAGNAGDASASPFSSSSRSATIPKRFGGDSSSHGKPNPFNSATTPGGRIMSPTGASSAFGLGSGAFSSFGSVAKTPKSSGGNPFDFGAKSSSSATAASASASLTSLTGEKPSSTTPQTTAPVNLGNSSVAGKLGAAGDKGKHPLVSEWVFWFRPPISKANGYIEYEKTLHPIAAVGSVEEFFTIYRHLKRPSTLPLVSDYHFFRTGIRPIWEDAENRKGGKWIVRLKKGVADRYWEDLLLAIVGDQLGDSGDEVCGVVLSVRNGEDILSIWTRNDGSSVLKVRETMKRVLEFPFNTKVEWKSHGSSIQQRSAIEESRREKPNNHHHHHHHNNNINNSNSNSNSNSNNNNNNGGNNSASNHYHHNNHSNTHGYSQHQHQSDKRSSKQSLSLSGGEDQQQSHARSSP